MTTAVCIKCGEFKVGAFTQCKSCSYQPDTYEDLAVSISLSDKYFKVDSLRSMSVDIKNGEEKVLHPKNLEVLIKELKETISPEMIKAFQKPKVNGTARSSVSWPLNVDTSYEFLIERSALLQKSKEKLVFNSEKISYEDKVFSFSSIDGFTIGARTSYINVLKTGTHCRIIIRAGEQEISLSFGDKLYGHKKYDFYTKIVNALHASLVPAVVSFVSRQIASGRRLFAIKQSVFHADKITTNRSGVFGLGASVIHLPYSEAFAKYGDGQVALFSKDQKARPLLFSLFDDENACIVPLLLNVLRKSR